MINHNPPNVMYLIDQGEHEPMLSCEDQFPAEGIEPEDTELYIKASEVERVLKEVMVLNRSCENMLFSITNKLRQLK